MASSDSTPSVREAPARGGAGEEEDATPTQKADGGGGVVPAKPKYATHEEAKAAFKELLRDKVRKHTYKHLSLLFTLSWWCV